MKGIVAFTGNMVCLSVLSVVAEFSVPEGPLKQAVRVAVGLTFLGAAVEQILGIFARMGV